MKRSLIKAFFRFSVFCFLFSVLCSLFSVSYADTIETRDGREIKGIVVEDYHDRIVISTIDGETQILKSDIAEMSYDNEDENLIKLAERAKDRNDYPLAYAYYNRALKINPKSKLAKEGVVYLQGFLYRREEAKKEEDVKRRMEYERYQIAGPEERTEEDFKKEELNNLRATLGLALKCEGNIMKVTEVRPDLPAAAAGLKKDDSLVAIWGRLTGYMDIQDVMKTLTDRRSIELKVAIERDVTIDLSSGRSLFTAPKDLIGAALLMEFDGLTVGDVDEDGAAAKGGLRKGDLVVSIDGGSTRYMPLKAAIELIRNHKGDSIIFRIRRETTIWRKT